jgi:hypothetical protein
MYALIFSFHYIDYFAQKHIVFKVNFSLSIHFWLPHLFLVKMLISKSRSVSFKSLWWFHVNCAFHIKDVVSKVPLSLSLNEDSCEVILVVNSILLSRLH